jgi:hypothetical protein
MLGFKYHRGNWKKNEVQKGWRIENRWPKTLPSLVSIYIYPVWLYYFLLKIFAMIEKILGFGSEDALGGRVGLKLGFCCSEVGGSLGGGRGFFGLGDCMRLAGCLGGPRIFHLHRPLKVSGVMISTMTRRRTPNPRQYHQCLVCYQRVSNVPLKINT